jgi:hypothetical protein
LPLTADLGDYDHIGIFNEPRKKELLGYATHHFMRSNKKDLSHHGGEEYIGKTSAQIVLCDGGKHAKDLQNKFASLKIFLANCRSYATDYPAAGLGKAPSTGYGMLKMYQSWGWEVTLACFSWEGLKVHDWEFERKSCLKMVQDGRLKIIDSKTDQLSLVPMQIAAAPLVVKKPCGCKSKKGA